MSKFSEGMEPEDEMNWQPEGQENGTSPILLPAATVIGQEEAVTVAAAGKPPRRKQQPNKAKGPKKPKTTRVVAAATATPAETVPPMTPLGRSAFYCSAEQVMSLVDLLTGEQEHIELSPERVSELWSKWIGGDLTLHVDGLEGRAFARLRVGSIKENLPQLLKLLVDDTK